MNQQQAIEALCFHGGTHADVQNPRWTNGFLGCLRPYQGSLHEDNFHEVMAAIATLARVDGLAGPQMSHEVMAALWGIVHLGRAWGVQEGGMLRTNKLISDEDAEELEDWVWTISYAVLLALEGSLNATDLDYEPPDQWKAVWEALG
jgi:hypothetical protein